MLTSLTEFWTIFMRCLLIIMTMAGMSTTFSRIACSRAMSMAISVPVLPTPALQGEKEEMMKSSKRCTYFQCTYSHQHTTS